MSGFSVCWLSMREPYDRAARNVEVVDAVAVAFAGASAATVTDLGCGTGATMRAIAPRLPARQSWRLVDNDQVLLDVARTAAPAGASVTTVVLDLAQAIEQALDSCDLVATSALLDLVSAAWLDRLVAGLARLSRPFYAALSYDGVVALAPDAVDDAAVISAVNRHQRTDKGFGPALGPDAARVAPARFRDAGFMVLEGRSDWRIGSDDREVQMEMLDGWAGAARAIGVAPATLEAWLGERRDHVAAGRSQMRVGHVDFFATPTGRR
jgi:SAM-dependent methyltransferase